MDAVTTPDLDLDGDATDELFDVLADRSRRRIVSELATDEPLSVESLARRLAQDDESTSERTTEIRLVHSHLPQLEAADVVAYDRADRQCELADTDAGASVGRILRAAGSGQ